MSQVNAGAEAVSIGPMKGSLSVGCQLKILHNVRCRIGNETISVGLKRSVKCWVTKSVSGDINFGLDVNVGWK